MKKLWLLSFFLLFISQRNAAEEWITYEECVIEDERYFDGDSFYVKALTGHTYIFRLYGVDCPETDDRFAERLKVQAKEFGVGGEDLLVWGEKAREFAKSFLGKSFTVHTQKKVAMGQSKMDRYFAVVVNGDGLRLDEALLAAGLARAFGLGAKWPEGTTYDDFQRRLRSIESKAKRNKLGIWASQGENSE